MKQRRNGNKNVDDGFQKKKARDLWTLVDNLGNSYKILGVQSNS